MIPSGVPTVDLLRDGACHALITPRPPAVADLVQKRLFEDRYAVFFDASQGAAPAHLADCLASDHVTVVYGPHRQLDLDAQLAAQGVVRRFVATVLGFAALQAFLSGSRYLATAPSLLRGGLLRGLATAEPPLPCPAMPMYLVWHVRLQADAMHQWLRQVITDSVAPALLAAGWRQTARRSSGHQPTLSCCSRPCSTW